jgi:hypothetical protein
MRLYEIILLLQASLVIMSVKMGGKVIMISFAGEPSLQKRVMIKHKLITNQK